ncbi:MAG TPA: hypothetical protein VHL30_04095 [Chlamydiales bacterium]|jgi:hypothetical protein|nr:hypothetical protein [Chlamydiales bacterium]
MKFDLIQPYRNAADLSPFVEDKDPRSPNGADPAPFPEDNNPSNAADLSPFPEETPEEILWRQQMAKCELERRKRQL